MFKLKKLDRELVNNINADAFLSLYGENACSIEEIKTTCFASEKCMYGGNADFDSLLNSRYKYVILNYDNKFSGCVAAEVCSDGRVPYFPDIFCKTDSLYLHTLCVESKYRNKGLATRLVEKIKSKNKTIFLTVLNGKYGKKSDLEYFFQTRSQKLVDFYKKNGFEVLKDYRNLILMKYN